MANPKKGRWVLISDGNPEDLARFFRGCREQGIETQGTVVNCPQGDFDWPKNWGPQKEPVTPKPGDEWFGLLWSDQCPQSTKWDISLIEAVRPWTVVSSLEGVSGDLRQGAVAWGVGALNAGGMVNFPHLDLDLAAWGASAVKAKCLYVERVQLPRKRGPNSSLALTAAVKADALKECMDRNGVKICDPDYKGVSLLIATPSISNPQADYMISLMGTLEEFRNLGVPVQWSMERWNADICMARSHILTEFLQTNHTHLLMIDDDMTWDTSAIHRLFWADKDIVAVAGPKKSYPLRFAASHTDAKGLPVPLQVEATGVAEVTSVGAAFMLIKRRAIREMVQAFPDLHYVGSDGKDSSALFLQQVIGHQYLPEDFSFCQRWRSLGGRIYIAPDVALGHVGQHVYKGDLVTSSLKTA